MKRALTILTALLFILLSAAAPARCETAAGSAAGRWYLTLAGYHNSDTAFDAASAGLAMTLDLREDGTGDVIMPEGGFSATWSEDSGRVTVVIQGDPVAFTRSPDGQYLYIYMNQYGLDLYFERTAAVSAAPGEAVAAKDASDFSGEWSVTTVVLGDNYYDFDFFTAQFGADRLEALGFADNRVSVENGTLRLFSSVTVGDLRPDADGRLSGESANGRPVTLTLYADGRMGVLYGGITWICTKK